MARKNDSSQVKECLQHEHPKEERDREKEHDRESELDHERERDPKKECDHEKERDHEKDRDRERDGRSKADFVEAGWVWSSASSPGGSGLGDRGAFGGAEGGRLAKTSWGDEPSSCCSLKDLKTISQCEDKLGHLKFSPTHAVLVDVEAFNRRGELIAQHGRDMWHRDFVKLPSSESSKVTVKTGPFMTKTVTRWRTIQHHLTPLSQKPAASVADVAEAIMKYNPKYKTQWSFNALTTVFQHVPETDNYYRTLFPKIAALALKLSHHVQKAIPLLQRGHAASITLSQAQISCLLANAFFCTFPHRNTTDPKAEYHKYPSINFNSLFGDGHDRKNEKLRAILHYFKEVTDRKPQGLVTFERRVLKDTDVDHWKHCKEKMPKLYVSSEGSIENEGTDLLQVDFASCWIGGGILSSGLVQEEILFSINPELIVSRLFTEKLEHNECLIITGSQQFSSYSGYGDKFEWIGPHEDKVRRDKWGRLQRQILAIDALNLKQKKDQYTMMNVTRELNKAYCGFRGTGRDEPDIATGKWGCGAFNGDPQLKAVIQLMAAARARRGLAFFTFKDYALAHQLARVHHMLVTEGTTVDQLFGILNDFCAVQQASGAQIDLFEFIRNSLGPSKSLL